jgi:hypothetical protein
MKKLYSILFALAIVAGINIPTLGQAGRNGRGGNSFKNSTYHSTPRATPAKSPVSRSSVSSTAPRTFSSLASNSPLRTSPSNRAITQATNRFQANASRITTNPGMDYARQQKAFAKTSGPLRLYKWDTEGNQINPAGEGHSLYLPKKGNRKANWKANSTALRQEMALKRPIMDSHTNSDGQLIKTGGGLGAERSALKGRGYNYNTRTRTWANTTN